MRPPPAGLISFINVSSCSLIKWAGRVEKTWEKFMYMLLHYCTPERLRVKAELRKQTQWPREKMWMFTSHLTCKSCCISQHSFFYSVDLALILCNKAKITFPAPQLTQFTPACWAVSSTMCTVGIVIYIVIVIYSYFFIHSSFQVFISLLFHLWLLSLKPVNFFNASLETSFRVRREKLQPKAQKVSHRLWVLSLYCSSRKGSRAWIELDKPKSRQANTSRSQPNKGGFTDTQDVCNQVYLCAFVVFCQSPTCFFDNGSCGSGCAVHPAF